VDPRYMGQVKRWLQTYGPDNQGAYSTDELCLIHHAFHTTPECTKESQPYIFESGDILMWDGRLDNREELSQELGGRVSTEISDLAIVACALKLWGTSCFMKLLGDWALCFWKASEKLLLLAKDYMGIRH